MSKYRIVPTNRFRKDLKAAKKRHYDLDLLKAVVDMLADGMTLPKEYKDHPLSGNFGNYRECHITPDWLLVYDTDDDELILLLARTGTQSDLF